jgi:hypothetical protein
MGLAFGGGTIFLFLLLCSVPPPSFYYNLDRRKTDVSEILVYIGLCVPGGYGGNRATNIAPINRREWRA